MSSCLVAASDGVMDLVATAMPEGPMFSMCGLTPGSLAAMTRRSAAVVLVIEHNGGDSGETSLLAVFRALKAGCGQRKLRALYVTGSHASDWIGLSPKFSPLPQNAALFAAQLVADFGATGSETTATTSNREKALTRAVADLEQKLATARRETAQQVPRIPTGTAKS